MSIFSIEQTIYTIKIITQLKKTLNIISHHKEKEWSCIYFQPSLNL